MVDIKKIDIKEFREEGYLQEMNRQFLHPLGLAVEVVIDENGNEVLGGIWDYREDNEGIIYSESILSSPEAKQKYENIRKRMSTMAKSREAVLGYHIQPVGGLT